MTPQTTDHPQWATDSANRLLYALSHCTDRAVKLDFICLFLREAYHRGGRDTCDELRKK